jgi:glucokinase
MESSKKITIVVSDLGGTNVRFKLGVIQVNTGELTFTSETKRYKTHDFMHEDYDEKTKTPIIPGFETIMNKFLSEMKLSVDKPGWPEVAVIAIAGPI